MHAAKHDDVLATTDDTGTAGSDRLLLDSWVSQGNGDTSDHGQHCNVEVAQSEAHGMLGARGAEVGRHIDRMPTESNSRDDIVDAHAHKDPDEGPRAQVPFVS